MALIADIPANGLTATQAYLRISDILVKKDDSDGTFYITYGVSCYVNEEARNAENPRTFASIEVDRFKVKGMATPPMNPYNVAYNDLKAQPSVTNAQDV